MKKILVCFFLVVAATSTMASEDGLVYFPPLGDATVLNYEFDLSRVSIDHRDLATYINMERRHNSYLLRMSDDEAYDKILQEIERAYVENTNAYIQKSSVVQNMRRNYNSRLQLSNNTASRFKLRICLSEFDEDGEHTVYVDILDQEKNGALVTSFTVDNNMDVDLSKDFVPFFKDLKKAGRRLGEAVVKIVQNANNRKAKAYLTL